MAPDDELQCEPLAEFVFELVVVGKWRVMVGPGKLGYEEEEGVLGSAEGASQT